MPRAKESLSVPLSGRLLCRRAGKPATWPCGRPLVALGQRLEEQREVLTLCSRGVLAPAEDRGVEHELGNEQDGREEHQQAGPGDPAGVRQQHESHGDRCGHQHVAAERPARAAPSDTAKDVGGVDGGEPGVGGIGDRLAAPDGGVDASPAGASGARCHAPPAGCLEQGRAHARVIGSQEPVL